ncbi:GntR family transcriptional regulator [Streptomyces sp. NPDC002537]
MAQPREGRASPLEPGFRDLAAEIERGELGPGRPLPSEKELVERYGAARNTARSALSVLREQGLVYTVPGRGTYVSEATHADESKS